MDGREAGGRKGGGWTEEKLTPKGGGWTEGKLVAGREVEGGWCPEGKLIGEREVDGGEVDRRQGG